MSHPSLSHIELECWKSLIQGKIHIQTNETFEEDKLEEKFERMPRIFVKLSFRELYDSKLSGSHPVDNMAIINLVEIGQKQ